ncbi:MAG TPA: hypothetical protein P5232_02780 [Candidatus Moranbacteria bacterium]|nr:hypothetical protein [Candidatus Moranbacteria bacterium]
MEKKNKKILLVLLLLTLVSSAIFSFGANVQAITASEQPESLTYATVAKMIFQNVKIVSQDEDKLKINFDLTNKDKFVQPETKYYFELVQENKKGEQIIIDYEMFPEAVTLSPNQSVSRQIEYDIPDYLEGKYQLWLKAGNSFGLPFSFKKISDLNLKNSSRSAYLDSSKCYLQIKEDNDVRKKYALNENVVLKAEENLILNCLIKNNFNQEISLNPKFETFENGYAGSPSEQENNSNLPITLAAGEKKQVSLIVPKAELSHIYGTALTLQKEGNDFSNKIIFYYALIGQGASINNFKLDKDNYKKGEIAQASFIRSYLTNSSSYDNSRKISLKIPENKTYLALQIIGEKNQPCSELIQKELSSKNNLTSLEIPIIRDCQEFEAKIIIKNEKGDVITDQKISFTSQERKNNIENTNDIENKKEDSQVEKTETTGTILSVIMLIIILVGLVILLWVIRRKIKNGRNGFFTIFVFLFVAPALFFAKTESAKAGDYVTIMSSLPSCIGVFGNADVDLFEYEPGEEIKVYGRIYAGGTYSLPTGTSLSDAELYIDNRKVADMNHSTGIYRFSAPTKKGHYEIEVKLHVCVYDNIYERKECYDDSGYLGYDVVPYYKLTINKSGSGTGTVSGKQWRNYKYEDIINCGSTCTTSSANISSAVPTSVELTATPDSGSTFAGWDSDLCTSVTGDYFVCNIHVNSSNKTLIAEFISASSCTPVCGDPSAHCTTETWMSSNNCGSCTGGTKSCCNDSCPVGRANTCIGQDYISKCPSHDNCGPGTKDCTWQEVAP